MLRPLTIPSFALFLACTISDPPQIGASLVAAAGPQLPKPSPTKPKMPLPQVQLCPTKPDLVVQSVEMLMSANGWAYMCARVANKGGVAWASQASQLSITLTDVDAGKTANVAGFTSLAVNAERLACAWLRAPLVLRHGQPNPANTSECPHKLETTARLVYDPDITLDGNTANDDCRKTNDSKTVEVPHVTTCLI
jgi:hypothetical protein